LSRLNILLCVYFGGTEEDRIINTCLIWMNDLNIKMSANLSYRKEVDPR